MNRFRTTCLALITIALTVSVGSVRGHAETIELTPDGDWFARLSGNDLSPGDEVVLREGVYSESKRLILRHRGSKEQPILIRAATGETVVFQRPDANQNTFNLEGTRHLILRGFEITGGSSGIRIGPHGDLQSGDLVLEDLHLHHIKNVAITCNFENATYERITFRRNHIHHTGGHGEAFYLGGNNASAILSNCTIENNYIHHLNGPTVTQGDGIEIKQGSFGNRIVNNIIHDTNYPAITVYGTAGNSPNVIENNLIWNTGDHGIQAAADAVIRNNWIAGAGGCGIYSRDHQGAVPSNLMIENNVVIADAQPALRLIGSGTADRNVNIRIVGNVFRGRPDQLAVRLDNFTEIRAEENQGTGKIQAKGLKQTFKMMPAELTRTPPELSQNPAWQFIRREQVLAKFSINEGP